VSIALLQDRQEIDLSDYGQTLDIQPLLAGQQPIWIKALPTLTAAFRQVNDQGWDIVHCHMDGSLSVAALGGARNICYTVHNSEQGHWKGVGLHRLRSLVEWWITRRSDVAVAGCGPGATEWAVGYLAHGHKNIRCIPNGIRLQKFPFRQEPWMAHSPLRILMVGKLAAQKNHEMAFRAIAYLLQQGISVELSIAGDGQLHDYLADMAAHLGVTDQVHFLGLRDDISELYQENDIFWLTSLHEGLPLVLLEAIASGIPVVATDVAGIREIGHDLNTTLVAADDAAELAQVTQDWLSRPEWVEKNRLIGRKHIETFFSASRMAQEYLNLYTSLTGSTDASLA
jgi:glycosyltransferase involved in cell wall biosynthesis